MSSEVGASGAHQPTVKEVHSDNESGSESDAAPVEEPDKATGKAKKKKKKKKSKAAKLLAAAKGELPDEIVEQVAAETKAHNPDNPDINEEEVRKAFKAMKVMEMLQGKTGIGGKNAKDLGEHKFWRTQPVPQLGDAPPAEDGPIEPSKPREEVRQDPYPLPSGYEWSTVDIEDPVQAKEVYELLTANYVEDHDAAFRFRALQPPGYHKDWLIGVRVSSNKKLIAFIAGVPLKLRVRKRFASQFVISSRTNSSSSIIDTSEINFLCVHKKLRSKRLAPVLIKEVTRRCNLRGIFQAIYTAGVLLPTPVSTARYFHRIIQVQKLVDAGFTHVPRGSTMARMIRQNAVPDEFALPGLREMEEKDIKDVLALYEKYMQRFQLTPVMDEAEMRHHMLSGRGIGEHKGGRREAQVVWAYVVENPETKAITDFFSFYSLPSTITKSTTGEVVDAAYLFYYATDESGGDPAVKVRVQALITDALVLANKAKFDVFNALTLMDNYPFLKELNFGQGDGYLNYYLYNWRTAPLEGFVAQPVNEGGKGIGRGIGVVML
ncbi:glycylpeptide N-tetradecanoyltransferase [Rhizoctonia solani AG-1 IB]|uniref:Glycylpeptide N-tetradecanoyltransferase n=1 Tax=Thanatephorus cucumeris (strain AG1-IB / isolate 7/3/14) TaxID=1108050 RepID=M5BJ37_THACB|nr:glycylpeptide N-tetradecanoyltransferase [Rhizoctonia solani AG-1 IB]